MKWWDMLDKEGREDMRCLKDRKTGGKINRGVSEVVNLPE